MEHHLPECNQTVASLVKFVANYVFVQDLIAIKLAILLFCFPAAAVAQFWRKLLLPQFLVFLSGEKFCNWSSKIPLEKCFSSDMHSVIMVVEEFFSVEKHSAASEEQFFFPMTS